MALNISAKDLKQFVETIVQQNIANTTQFEQIFTGTIQSISGSIYTIQNHGVMQESISAKLIKDDINLVEGDAVYYLKAKEGLDTVYLILDKVESVEDKTFSLTLEDRFQANKEEELELINNTITYTNTDGLKLIQQTGTFKIAFLATNDTSNTQENYGIKVDIAYGDGDDQVILKTFIFDTRQFVGQPFNCNGLPQSKVFYIEDETICPTQEKFSPTFTKLIISTFGTNTISELGKQIRIEEIKLFTGNLIEIEAYLRVNTSIDKNKDYFAKSLPGAEFEDSIKLKAELFNNSNKITDSRTRYYWVVQNDSVVDSSSPGFLNITGAGSGWYCLNQSEMVDIIPENGKDFDTIRVWKANLNSIDLGLFHKDLFTKYVNNVKCIVKYGDNFVESKQFKIYNFEKENFSIEIENLSGIDLIIKKDDVIYLKATIFDVDTEGNKVAYTDNTKYTVNYQWYKNSYDEDNILEGYTSSTLNVKDCIENKNGEAVPAEETSPEVKKDFEMDASQVHFLCKVSFTGFTYQVTADTEKKAETTYYIKEANGTYSIFNCSTFEEGEIYYTYNEAIIYEEQAVAPITVSSVIYEEAEIIATQTYKYYLNTKNNLTFHKTENGDWASYEETGETFPWINGSYEKVFSALDIFNDNTKDWYVYYTTQTVWTSQKGDYTETLRTEDWFYPIIARQSGWNGVEWVNLKVGPAVDQLNTFNQLTRGGEDQGVYTQEMGTEINTETSTPNKTKKYYKKVINSGSVNYVPITLVEEKWPDDTPKIVYTDLKENLFINASYIQTGILRVGDAGNEKFYADVGSNNIHIGGFTVDENSLQANTGNRQVYLGTDGIKLTDDSGNSILEVKDGQAAFRGAISIQQATDLDNVVADTKIYYGLYKSMTEAPAADSNIWQETAPAWTVGKYMWQKIVTTYLKPVDNPKVEVKITCIQGAKGEAGEDAITYSIESNQGYSFEVNQTGTVDLVARIYQGSEELDPNGEWEYSWYTYPDDEALSNLIDDKDEKTKTIRINISDLRGKRIYFTTEGAKNTSILGKAILGTMILGE